MSILLLEPNDVDPRDDRVIREAARFGVLTTEQIERRYEHPELARHRIAFLEEFNVIEKRSDTLEGVDAIYQLTTRPALSPAWHLSPRRINRERPFRAPSCS